LCLANNKLCIERWNTKSKNVRKFLLKAIVFESGKVLAISKVVVALISRNLRNFETEGDRPTPEKDGIKSLLFEKSINMILSFLSVSDWSKVTEGLKKFGRSLLLRLLVLSYRDFPIFITYLRDISLDLKSLTRSKVLKCKELSPH